jgi:transcriptional regulator with XRE-family HTH domain
MADPEATRLGAVIRQARVDARMTQTQLAERIGQDQTQVSRWELAKAVPTVLDVSRLEVGLLLRPGDLLIRAGLVEMPPLDTERAIQADPILDDESRSIMLRFYRAAVLIVASDQSESRRPRASTRKRAKT